MKAGPPGCSLGATFLYAYLAHNLDSHPFGALVSLGDPLRWESTHPIDRFIFARLESEAIVPSPIADRRTLARRLSLDLLGLFL